MFIRKSSKAGCFHRGPATTRVHLHYLTAEIRQAIFHKGGFTVGYGYIFSSSLHNYASHYVTAQLLQFSCWILDVMQSTFLGCMLVVKRLPQQQRLTVDACV